MKKYYLKIIALLILIIIYFAIDTYLTKTNPLKYLECFPRNDFEIVQILHSGDSWDKVIFGNSTITSAYIEGDNNYINCGVDYGILKDLEKALNKKDIIANKELILALNFFTFYDDFDTNPTYIWHKDFYEPYCYFERDRFNKILVKGFDNYIHGKEPLENIYTDVQKPVYYGKLSEEEMAKKIETYEEKYWHLPISSFSEDIKSLDNIIKYCEDKNIEIKVIWMPWNPDYYKPENYIAIQKAANEIINKHALKVLDLTDKISSEYFHDIGHLSMEKGAPYFTNLINVWLEEDK